MTPTRSKADSLRLRVLSAMVGIPLLIVLVWASVYTTEVLVAVSAVIALYEFCRLGPTPMALPLVLLTLSVGVLFTVNAALGGALTVPLVTGAVTIPLLLTALLPAAQRSSASWAWSVAGMLLVGWTLSLAVLLRMHAQGREWLIVTIGLTFAIDTSAYFFGKVLGRRKLAPTISPGKTWEGAIAGFLVGGVAAVVLTQGFGLDVSWYLAAALGLTVSVAAQLGDLAESMIKRGVGAKDAGSLVPGHGGLLDRLDSLIPSCAVVYFFVTLLG